MTLSWPHLVSSFWGVPTPWLRPHGCDLKIIINNFSFERNKNGVVEIFIFRWSNDTTTCSKKLRVERQKQQTLDIKINYHLMFVAPRPPMAKSSKAILVSIKEHQKLYKEGLFVCENQARLEEYIIIIIWRIWRCLLKLGVGGDHHLRWGCAHFKEIISCVNQIMIPMQCTLFSIQKKYWNHTFGPLIFNIIGW